MFLQPSTTSNSSPLWNAYSSAVKKFLGEIGGNQVLLLRSFTEPWIVSSGTHIPDEFTNYHLHKVADELIDPSTGKEVGSYVKQLNSYLSWVDVGAVQNEKTKTALDAAKNDFDEAELKYKRTLEKAQAAYKEEDEPKLPFEQWALYNYPELAVDKATRDGAEMVYNKAYKVYWGRTGELEPLLKRVKEAQDRKTYHPSLNMKATNTPHEATEEATYIPVYTASGLHEQLNKWIEHGGGVQKRLFEVKIDSTTPPVGNDGDASKETAIYLEMWTRGPPVKFVIHSGEWDVPRVRKLFPKLLPDAPKVLDSSATKPFSFLVGYDVQLKMTIKQGDNSVGSNVNTFVSTNEQQTAAHPVVLAIIGQHL